MHAIFDCPIAQETMRNFSLAYHELSAHSITINRKISLIGFPAWVTNTSSLNTILTLIKQRLILQRERKVILSKDLIKEMILRQINLEKYMAKKQNNMMKHNMRWSQILTRHDQ